MGPFNPQARGELNVDEIVQQGLASTGVGAAPVTTTTGAPPEIPGTANPADPSGIMGGVQMSATQPEWGFRPVAQDFGQADVRRGNYETGMVPTVDARMPFGALASRQTAAAQRRAALAEKMAAFNPYGGIGKAHDRYQTAFNKYATGQIDTNRKQLADQMFRGDMKQADQFLASDPQGQAMLRRWGSNLEALGSENKAWTDAAIETLADVRDGKYYVPPETLATITEFASAVGADGMPVPGANSEEFLAKMRDAGGKLQEVKYVSEVIKPGMADAMQSLTGFNIEDKRRGNKYVITSTEKKTFDDALRQIVKSDPGFVDGYYGGDEEAAMKALQAYYPTSIKETVGFESPFVYPQSGSGGDKEKLQQRAYDVTYAQLPPSIFTKGKSTQTVMGFDGKPMIDPNTGKPKTKDVVTERTPTTEAVFDEYPTMNLFDIVSGQGRTPVVRQFRTITKQGGVGEPVWMHPTQITNVGGKLFIVGKKGGAPRTSATGEAVDPLSENVQGFTELEDVLVPYDGNEAIVEQSFPSLTDQGIRQSLGWTGGVVKNARKSSRVNTDSKSNVTQEQYAKLKPGDKYWYNGEELTKE